MKITPEVRYEAQLNSALAQRALAEEVLSNPVFEPTRRAERLQGSVNPATRPVRPSPPPPPQRLPGEAPSNEGSVPDSEAVELPAEVRAEMEAAASPDSASLADSLAAQLATDMALAAADTQAVAPLTDEQKKQLEDAERSQEGRRMLLGCTSRPEAQQDVDPASAGVTHARWPAAWRSPISIRSARQ
jgi:hypothetical protein